MADTTPVNAPEKKGASASVSKNTAKALKEQHLPALLVNEAPYKKEGGAKLDSHDAVREDR